MAQITMPTTPEQWQQQADELYLAALKRVAFYGFDGALSVASGRSQSTDETDAAVELAKYAASRARELRDQQKRDDERW